MKTLEPGLGSEYFSDHQSILWEVLDRAFEGVVVTDPEGYILFMNQVYRNFLDVQEVVGRHVTEVIENTRMHIVAQTGKAELSSMQRIRNSDMIAHRIPVFHENQLIAVVGTVVFQDIRALRALHATVQRLHQLDTAMLSDSRQKLVARYTFDSIIGNGHALQSVKGFAKKVAKGDSTVLITGETGTGKELFAHAIHAESSRAMGPMVRVNCAAIPESLLESELFGYEEGSFTGAARKGRKGKFELAHGGTILLDEIGDMPLHLQAKLLRVLQEKEIERIGGAHPITIDVRFISSTNRSLGELVREGTFRADLYYRLSVVTIDIPPLRERREDLHPLVLSILGTVSRSTGIRVPALDDDLWPTLGSYSWPGNVRELCNILEHGLYRMDGDTLCGRHILFPPQTQAVPVGGGSQTLKDVVESAEKAAIMKALLASGHHKADAARQLGISKSSLYQKLAEYELDDQ